MKCKYCNNDSSEGFGKNVKSDWICNPCFEKRIIFDIPQKDIVLYCDNCNKVILKNPKTLCGKLLCFKCFAEFNNLV